MSLDQMALDETIVGNGQDLQQLSKLPINSSPIIMLRKMRISNNTRHKEYEKYRWKIYLWQLPDDLVSWYLPIQSSNEIIRLLRSFGVLHG